MSKAKDIAIARNHVKGEKRRGCSRCGSVCGVPNCLICEGNSLCDACQPSGGITAESLRHTDDEVFARFKKAVLTSSVFIRASYEANKDEFFASMIQMLARWASEQGSFVKADFRKALRTALESEYAKKYLKPTKRG